MAINGDYATPVTVNGFSCKNCTDVDYAKKNIDPAHPKDGPYGVTATDKVRTADGPGRTSPSVIFGGDLAGPQPQRTDPVARQTGSRVDLFA